MAFWFSLSYMVVGTRGSGCGALGDCSWTAEIARPVFAVVYRPIYRNVYRKSTGRV
jgi:hypothetical protein